MRRLPNMCLKGSRSEERLVRLFSFFRLGFSGHFGCRAVGFERGSAFRVHENTASGL